MESQSKLKKGLTKKILKGCTSDGQLMFFEKFFDDYYYFENCIEDKKPEMRQTLVYEWFKPKQK